MRFLASDIITDASNANLSNVELSEFEYVAPPTEEKECKDYIYGIFSTSTGDKVVKGRQPCTTKLTNLSN